MDNKFTPSFITSKDDIPYQIPTNPTTGYLFIARKINQINEEQKQISLHLDELRDALMQIADSSITEQNQDVKSSTNKSRPSSINIVQSHPRSEQKDSQVDQAADSATQGDSFTDRINENRKKYGRVTFGNSAIYRNTNQLPRRKPEAKLAPAVRFGSKRRPQEQKQKFRNSNV